MNDEEFKRIMLQIFQEFEKLNKNMEQINKNMIGLIDKYSQVGKELTIDKKEKVKK
jgi:methyl coenzyme M reductase subunit D